MAKILTDDETHKYIITLSDNHDFINRLDEFEKREMRKKIDHEIFLFDHEVKIGMKNIYDERKKKIDQYRIAAKWLRLNEIRKQLESLDKNQGESSVKHRVNALAYTLRVESSEAEQLSRAGKRLIGGKNYEQAFDTLNPKSKAFRQPTLEEYQEALTLLNDHPKASELAKCEIRKLENEK